MAYGWMQGKCTFARPNEKECDMTVESDTDLEGLKRIGEIVANALQTMIRAAQPGMTTRALDDIGTAFLAEHGARSAPRITYNFPGTTCISVNEDLAHGIPGDKVLKSGDLVNIDVSAELDGYFGDTGASFVLGGAKGKMEDLCVATREARDAGIQAAVAGRRINEIGKAIEKVARKRKYAIIENLGSHGVGRKLHEEPEGVASFFDPSDTRVLHEGLVMTVEPFLTTGPTQVVEGADGWTLSIPRKHRGAQFEHSIVVTRGAPLILTLPSIRM